MKSGSRVVETGTGRMLLPDWHALLAAFRGERGVLPGDHLILKWAGALAHLHRTLLISPARTAEINRRRVELTEMIVNWVSTYILSSATDAMRVGCAVDGLASAYVDAEFALATAESVSALAVHEAWSEASAHAVRWADLVAEVVYRQPPIPWHPERPNQ